MREGIPYVSRPTIGGSDIGAILGVNRYADAGLVYDRITAAIDGREFPSVDNPNMERGRVLEDQCAAKFARDTGHELLVPGVVVFNSAYPHFHANPDRLITRGPLVDQFAGCVGIYEGKVPRASTFRVVRDLGVDPSYLAQVQLYMLVTGCAWGQMAYLNADEWELLAPAPITTDPVLVEAMLEAADTFMGHVARRERPGATFTEATALAAAHVDAAAASTGALTVIDDPAWAEAVADLLEKKAAKKLAEHACDEAESRMKEMLERAGVYQVMVPGAGKVTWNEQSKPYLDTDALALAHPDVDLAQFTKRSSFRVLRPSRGKA